MSSEVSTPEGEINTRFSTPAPELDDHRKTKVVIQPSSGEAEPEPERLEVPDLLIQQPTPRPSVMGPEDLFRLGNHPVDHLQVDNTPRQMPTSGPGYSIARDFENAISDGEDDAGPSPLIRARNDTMRGRRPRDFRPADRSRDTSSSRSTSPANSVEAFAEPRRRQRANTVGSLPDSIEWQRFRAGSHDDVRRPTLSSINVPAAVTQSRTHTQRADDADRDFDLDSEPGKTYRIDFEELEEFVALSKQGLIPSDSESSANSDTKVFLDQRPDHRKQAVPNAQLNGEYFYEKPLEVAEKPQENLTDPEPPKPMPQPVRSQKDRFTFFSSELGQAKFANTLGDFIADGSKFQELFDVGPEGGVWWLDVLNPTKAELDVLASAFKIHRLTKEDIETQEPREKVELFSQYYFVCFRSFNMNQLSEDFLDPIHLYIIVTQDGVLSFSYTPNPHAKSVRKRISKLGDFVSLGPDYICYALIDDIVDSFAPIIRHAETESENIEDQVFIARDEDFSALLRQIGDARKRVLNMMRLLGGKADVIKGFAKRCNEQFEITPRGDIGLYLGDIQDHVITMMSNLGHVEKMLSRSHANYLAQLNVDHLLKGNNTNKALAKITVFATILVPLNLITGLFGMNVHVPGMGEESFAWFGGIVSTIAVFITVSLLIAKRLRLI